jgi:hypothetical protein
MTMIDDATNVRRARFFEEETQAAAMTVLSYWIKTYGILKALYCGHKNAFVPVREPTDAELLAGRNLSRRAILRKPVTNWER